MDAPTSLPRPGRGRMSASRRAEFERDVADVVHWMRGYVRRLGFSPVSRSWLYAFESEGIISKGDFDWVLKWVADRRREGLIPFELVAEDDSRALSGSDYYDKEATPREYINRTLKEALERAEHYWPSSYWKHQTNYPILWTEKRDLIKLFEPELPSAVRRFASKGQDDINAKVNLLREIDWAYEHDLEPVVLVFTDHDPAGMQIFNNIEDKLRPLAEVMGIDHLLNDMVKDERFVRFGLDADFIDRNGLLWVDNLETSGGKDLADPKHPQHNFPYVQTYLEQFGARKCEANSLIARPRAARYLIHETLWEWLCHEGNEQWKAENRAAQKDATHYADGIKRMLALFDTAGVLYNPAQLQAAVTGGIASLPGDAPGES